MNCIYGSIISILPVVEVRGSIPYLISMGCSYLYIILSYFLSTMTGIIVYFLIEEILKLARAFLSRFWKGGEAILNKIIERTERKASEKIEKYGTIGLIIFVAIPLPGTGVWTGALAGYLLGLRARDVIIALVIGNAIATLLVSLAASGIAIALK